MREKFSLNKVEGNKGKETKVVSFQDATQLVMILPGRVIRETRQQFANIGFTAHATKLTRVAMHSSIANLSHVLDGYGIFSSDSTEKCDSPNVTALLLKLTQWLSFQKKMKHVLVIQEVAQRVLY